MTSLFVTWLWQGLAIASLTALALRAMPRLNAATRHAVWWLAFAAVLAIPVVHAVAYVSAKAPSMPGLPRAAAAGIVILPAIPDPVIACAMLFWALTVAVGIWRLARSCRAVGRLKRASSPFDGVREARLPIWLAARSSCRRPAELRTSDCRTGACALGLGRPVILVSRSLADALGDDALDEIVMHEQAHLERCDDWSQLVQAIVCSLAGLHPAVRLIARQIAVNREAACDDHVVTRTGAARRYASSLLAAAARGVQLDELNIAPAAISRTSTLGRRVDRLLDPRLDRSARLAKATSLASVAALALAVMAAPQVRPIVAFVDRAIATAPLPDPPVTRTARIGNPVANGIESTRPHRPALLARQGRETTAIRPAPAETPPLPSRPITGITLVVQGVAPASNTPSRPVPLWSAVADSATAAAIDTARTAAAAGAEARGFGVSIGGFMTRAGNAVAKRF